MSEKIPFNGLTWHGVPMVFDGPTPERAGVCLVFMYPEQIEEMRRLGMPVHVLVPDCRPKADFYLVPQLQTEGVPA